MDITFDLSILGVLLLQVILAVYHAGEQSAKLTALYKRVERIEWLIFGPTGKHSA